MIIAIPREFVIKCPNQAGGLLWNYFDFREDVADWFEGRSKYEIDLDTVYGYIVDIFDDAVAVEFKLTWA